MTEAEPKAQGTFIEVGREVKPCFTGNCASNFADLSGAFTGEDERVRTIAITCKNMGQSCLVAVESVNADSDTLFSIPRADNQ